VNLLLFARCHHQSVQKQLGLWKIVREMEESRSMLQAIVDFFSIFFFKKVVGIIVFKV